MVVTLKMESMNSFSPVNFLTKLLIKLHIMNDSNRTKSLQLLRDGFKQDFAGDLFESEEFFELLMNKSLDFVTENVPLVNDDDAHDLALLLVESIKVGNF